MRFRLCGPTGHTGRSDAAPLNLGRYGPGLVPRDSAENSQAIASVHVYTVASLIGK